MPQKYVSVDVEAAGKTPGKYSMLSFGACIVGSSRTVNFYRELKPINGNYDIDAMRIGCLGLKVLDDLKNVDEYNPKSDRFNPELVLKVLEEKGSDQGVAMYEFKNWVLASTKEHTPVLAAAPIAFDGMFIHWYFDNFLLSDNPFGYGGLDINSLYQGVVRELDIGIKALKLRQKGELTHNALEDAIQQAVEMEEVIRLMSLRNK